MKDELQLESFAAWVLAASLLTGNPDAPMPHVSMKTAAVELVQNNTQEHFVVLDETGKVVAAGSGERTKIGFGDDVVALIRDSSRKLSLLHNHPQGTSLSHDDIYLLISSPGLKSVSAVTADGMMYTITAARADAPKIFLNRFAKVEVELRKEWGGSKKLKTLGHQILTDMHKDGIVSYSASRFK